MSTRTMVLSKTFSLNENIVLLRANNKIIKMSTTRGPISKFMETNYLHFNAAAMMDAAKGYETHLDEGGKMMITLAGAMSTAELGISWQK